MRTPSAAAIALRIRAAVTEYCSPYTNTVRHRHTDTQTHRHTDRDRGRDRRRDREAEAEAERVLRTEG